MIVDFRKTHMQHAIWQPCGEDKQHKVSGCIGHRKLCWTNTASQVRKAHQCLYYLRKLKRARTSSIVPIMCISACALYPATRRLRRSHAKKRKEKYNSHLSGKAFCMATDSRKRLRNCKCFNSFKCFPLCRALCIVTVYARCCTNRLALPSHYTAFQIEIMSEETVEALGQD